MPDTQRTWFDPPDLASPMVADLPKPQRLELILRQIDTLPTLPAVATRLLQLTASDDATADEVVALVRCDPALTAKVLSMVRTADKGVGQASRDVLTVDRAVKLLGFQAVRNTVLSLKVFELFNPAESPDDTARFKNARPGDSPDEYAEVDAFDRSCFWTHCLAVAVLAESIAKAHPQHTDLDASEAFVCGLLHDIGKLALDMVLPKSFARCVQMAQQHQIALAPCERKIIGLDHHTAGKRLAEQWGLPHRLQDVIWLHGTPIAALPPLPHQRLVALIHLANLVALRQHAGVSGNYAVPGSVQALCQAMDFDPLEVQTCADNLFGPLDQHGRALGLHDQPSEQLLAGAMRRANATLGRLNAVLDRRSHQCDAQTAVLSAISTFHQSTQPGQSTQDTLDAVARSARSALGPGFYALVVPQPTSDAPRPDWLICQYPGASNEANHSQIIAAPPKAPDLHAIGTQGSGGMNLLGLLPWIADDLLAAPDFTDLSLLTLTCGWGTAALLLHDRNDLPPHETLDALTRTWGSAVAAAGQHQGARRLGEQLAEANSALAETQDRLLHTQSLARLGEMAAGAAHEMNNPLAVIAGRAQMLAGSLPPGSKDHSHAQQVVQESHRLSDLITCLHMFADPPRADRQPTELQPLLDEVVRKVRAVRRKRQETIDMSLKLIEPMPTARIDARQVARALTELMLNALQANPRTSVSVIGRCGPWGPHDTPTLFIQVIDDGEGMDAKTLAHATDPFFSAKPAGRQVGMGLPRALHYAAAHQGSLELVSNLNQGTTATLIIPTEHE